MNTLSFLILRCLNAFLSKDRICLPYSFATYSASKRECFFHHRWYQSFRVILGIKAYSLISPKILSYPFKKESKKASSGDILSLPSCYKKTVKRGNVQSQNVVLARDMCAEHVLTKMENRMGILIIHHKRLSRLSQHLHIQK